MSATLPSEFTFDRRVDLTVAADLNLLLAAMLSLSTQAGVPTDPPSGLPLNFDSTPVSGGLYGWTGASWVKLSVIP